MADKGVAGFIEDLKILHITTGLRNGGAETILFRLVTAADGSHTHEVVSLNGAGYFGGLLRMAAIPVHSLEIRAARLAARGFVDLCKIIQSVDPDVIQTWMYHADLGGGLASRVCGRRSVVWGVHNANLERGAVSTWTRCVAKACAKTSSVIPSRIVCSSEQAAQAHVLFGYDSKKVVIIHNGLDVATYAPNRTTRKKIREEWGICENEIVLGMVARWDRQKDHGNLLSALNYLVSRIGPAWRCVFVGDGMDPSNEALYELVKKSDVSDRILLKGLRDDIPAVMNALDLHVLSSSSEAFGNVTNEAMACGTPCVVTNVGAGALIVGKVGWVVPPRDPVALAEAILTAMNEILDSKSWPVRQAAARERIAKNFSLSHMVDAYDEVWSSVLHDS